MVAGFLDAITKVRQFRFHNDDDFIDRLSRRYSVVLLMLFTVVVSTKQYVGDRKYLEFESLVYPNANIYLSFLAISCWVPAQVNKKKIKT